MCGGLGNSESKSVGGLPQRQATHTQRSKLLAVNVKLEVLVIDGFVLAIAANRLDGTAKFLLQISLTFAQGDAGTDTEVLGNV
jgi:hypothetical protein